MDHKALADSYYDKKDYFLYLHHSKLQFENTKSKKDEEEYQKAKKIYELHKEIQKINSLCETDYYKIMNVCKNISKDDLKKKYNVLIMRYHPDKAKIEGSNEAYLRIKKAYEVLSKNTTRNIIESEEEENMEDFLKEMRMFQRRTFYTRPRNVYVYREREVSTEAFAVILLFFVLAFFSLI